MNVGIITWHYYPNFGSSLQAFALERVLQKSGFSTEIINYRCGGKRESLQPIKDFYRSSFHLFSVLSHSEQFRQRFYFASYLFQKECLKQSKLLADRNGLSAYSAKYDAVICGSDQIWAPNVLNSVYLLDFISCKKTRKISYAASIGLNEIPDNLVETYKTNLSDFYAISIRECAGRDQLKRKCDIDAEVVLDPTLLISANEWKAFEKRVGVSHKYVFCYFLNPSNEYRDAVKNYAQKNGLQIVGWSACEKDREWMDLLSWIGPREFLFLIDHADGVFTDSYHGTIFSLLFHKPFWHFMRFLNGDPVCQNSRIDQLNRFFNFSDRIISSSCDPSKCAVLDYGKFETDLSKLREESLLFLRKALT